MPGSKKIKRQWPCRQIVVFLIIMWIFTLLCRYFSAKGMPEVTTCRIGAGMIKAEYGKEELRYPECLPADILDTDERGDTYVYCIREESSIFGTALLAERKYVKIKQRDKKTAALEEGVLTALDEVIAHSSKALKPGMKVRIP